MRVYPGKNKIKGRPRIILNVLRGVRVIIPMRERESMSIRRSSFFTLILILCILEGEIFQAYFFLSK